MSDSLRILFTIQTLEGRAGGSLYVRDLALEALRQGHRPVVYTTRLGELAAEIRHLTVPVIDRLDRLTARPDVIHGNSPIETVAALLHFPDSPAIFVCHGWDNPDAWPPAMPGIVKYVAVDETCRDHLVCQCGIPDDRVLVRFNAVDLERFRLGAARAARPARALVFSNNAAEANYLPAIRAACDRFGIALDVAGEHSERTVDRPEAILGYYDLIFAKARCALEALASGAAVIVCDVGGLSALVTSANYDDLRRLNFGRRLLQRPVTADAVAAEIEKYDAADAARVTARVRSTEGLDAALRSMLTIWREAIDEAQSRPRVDDAAQRIAAAAFLETIAPFTNTFYATDRLRQAGRDLDATRRALDRLTSGVRMEPLNDAEQRAIRVVNLISPERVRAGEEFGILVDVDNGSSRLLASTDPAPISISYHWLSEDGSQVVHAEGLRSELMPFIMPGAARRCSATVLAPSHAGRYCLRVTLVQERVAWLEAIGANQFKDALVTVPPV